MSEAPDPLVPDYCDCTDLDGFMLNVERLMASELVALCTHEEIAAAVFLWCRAWKQRPAASLPDDDRVLAAFARLPLSRFKKIRTGVMHGFIKCSDGRLYHRVLSQEALNAYEKKLAFQKRRSNDAERLRQWRETQRRNNTQSRVETEDETNHETSDETRFVAEGQGQGQGQGHLRKKEGSKVSAASDRAAVAAPTNGGLFADASSDRAKRGRRIPDNWQPALAEREMARELGVDVTLAADEFGNYWRATSGKAAVKLDWDLTFRNRVRELAERGRFPVKAPGSNGGRQATPMSGTF